jgi:cell volume regulation protein A
VTRDAQLILIAGALLAAGVAASLLAARIRLPALVLFLGVGMLIGTDGLGWIDFEDYGLARFVGSVALLLILYEGGLSTGFRQIRPVLGSALSLAVVGTAGTALVAGLAATLLFDFSLQEGLLLGAILSATDGAAVFALLRGSTVPRRLALTLEGEAGLNDPIVVMLVLLVIELICSSSYGIGDALLFVLRELVVGVAVGAVVGSAAARALRLNREGATALSLVGSFAAAAVAFGAAGALHGSGFLAVYVAGLAVGDARLSERPSILAFHEGIASVAEIGMFFTLGLLVFPSQLGGVAVEGTLLALIIALVARPLALAVATAFSGFSRPDRIVLGWAGLRGAVPVVLATFPVLAHVPRSIEFFDIVFFAVVVSAALQGSTVDMLARRLGVVGDHA